MYGQEITTVYKYIYIRYLLHDTTILSENNQHTPPVQTVGAI